MNTANPTNPAPTTAQVDVAFDNHAVQRAAEHLAAQQHALLEAVGLRASIAEAIDATGTADPATVAATLGRWTADTDAAIAVAREARQQHDAQRLERRMAQQPLRAAVSARITTLCAERESLVGLIAAAANASRQTGATGQLRYQNLLASGLSDVQICSLGEDLRNPAVVTAEMQERITAIDALVEPLFVFSKDPQGDPAPLVGLGFDDLIQARLDAEVAA